LDRRFEITARGSTIRTEIAAGIVNFVANSYLVVLIPQVLHNGGNGLPQQAYLLSFVLSTCTSSILVGWFSNLPLPCGVGIGCATYFAYNLAEKANNGYGAGVLDNQKFSSTVGLVASLFMLACALLGLPWRLFRLIPACVKGAMPVGLGFLLALAGFEHMGLVVSSAATGVTLGDTGSVPVMLGVFGVVLAGFLHHFKWRSAMVVPMCLVAGIAWIAGLADLPEFSAQAWGDLFGTGLESYVDFAPFSWVKAALPIAAIYIICLFDVGGLTYAASSAAGLVQHQGEAEEVLPGAHAVFTACALGSILATMTGCPPVIVLGESFAGIMVGGRTGITAIVMGLCFVAVLPVAPIVIAIPLFASASVLVLLGVDLLRLVKFLDLDNGLLALPSFFTIALMPYLYSIDMAIVFGLAVHFALQTMLALSDPLALVRALKEAIKPAGAAEPLLPAHSPSGSFALPPCRKSCSDLGGGRNGDFSAGGGGDMCRPSLALNRLPSQSSAYGHFFQAQELMRRASESVGDSGRSESEGGHNSASCRHTLV
jgi:AGZA family xanthine/uracil permease-like MFS transporter